MARITLALFSLASVLFASSAFARKATVCTVTINSSDERELFKKMLNPRDFEFVELTGYGDPKNSESWFQAACQEKIKCDVLVVSAHFGGTFFGTLTNFRWSTKSIENHSCRNSCDGILKNPKEVYLFGCNTLAGKHKDRRSPEEYLQVLVRDNIDRQEAERIVAARYGPFGSSFGDIMARNFETVPMIYGFDSIGPSGMSVKKYLKSYLSKIGDYRNHLSSNDFERSRMIWKSEMRETHFATAVGLQKSSPAYEIRTNLCELQNDKKGIDERLLLSENLLDKSFHTYLPSVASFINWHLLPYGPESSFTWENLKSAVNQFRNRSDLAQKLSDVLAGQGITPSIRLDLLQTSKLLGWKSSEDYESEVKAIFASHLNNPKTEDADFICSNISTDEMKKIVPRDLILNYPFDSLPQLRIASCYGERDRELAKTALQGFVRHRGKIPQAQYFEALLTLDEFKGIEQEAAWLFRDAKFSNRYQSTYMDYRKLKYTTGAEQIALMQKLSTLANEDALSDIADAISENPVKNETVSKIYLEQLFRSKAVSEYSTYINHDILISAESFEDWFAEKLAHANPLHLDATVYAFSFSKEGPKSAKLSTLIINWLENRLAKNDHNTEFAFYALSRATLTLPQLGRLHQLYKRINSNSPQLENTRAFLRHILTSQGEAKLELENEILSGRKALYICETAQYTGGRHCYATSASARP